MTYAILTEGMNAAARESFDELLNAAEIAEPAPVPSAPSVVAQNWDFVGGLKAMGAPVPPGLRS